MQLYERIRPLLFRLDAERAHHLTLALLGIAGRLAPSRALLRAAFATPGGTPEVQAMGLRFPNPIGLAAGFDKDGVALLGLGCLGFGFIEVGTVTLEPQAGNLRPRLFRLPEDRALINRMGFPGAGAAALEARLRRLGRRSFVLGVNIGKGVDTSLERAAQDYRTLFDQFYPYADYFAVNVSSPNTVGLRRLQARRHLDELLSLLISRRRERAAEEGRAVPLLVKLAPDLSEAELDDALDALLSAGVEGVILTNTTLARPELRSRYANEPGGLSGDPLRPTALRMVAHVASRAPALTIIGVGGISSAAHVRAFQEAGAALVQVYTGLVYQGPGLVGSLLAHSTRLPSAQAAGQGR